jgi:hypothetical protein
MSLIVFQCPGEGIEKNKSPNAVKAPHVALIEVWLAAEPQLTAIAIVGRLAERHPKQFGKKQHSTVQRLLRALRKTAAQRLIAETTAEGCETIARPGLWTARALEGPTRPQPLFLFQPSMLITQQTSYGHPLGNILR